MSYSGDMDEKDIEARLLIRDTPLIDGDGNEVEDPFESLFLPEVSAAALGEARFDPLKHPRGRTGRWIRGDDHYAHHTGRAMIFDNGGGLGPAKNAKRWAVEVHGKWVANVDTLVDAKARAEDELANAAPDAGAAAVRMRGPGKGRKGRKVPAKGWRATVDEVRAQPVIGQRAVTAQIQSMAWERVTPEFAHSGTSIEYASGNARVVLIPLVGDRRRAEYEVYVNGEHRGTVGYDEANKHAEEQSRSVHETALEMVAPDVARERREWIDSYWGNYGKEAVYERADGRPGSAFREQHERVMRAGAAIDAEVERRVAKSDVSVRFKQAERAIREARAAVKKADAEATRQGYEVVRRHLVQGFGYDEGLLTVERVRAAHREFLRLWNKGGAKMSEEAYDVGEAWYSRFQLGPRYGLDVAAADDASVEARLALMRLIPDRDADERALRTLRRGAAYDVLRGVRDFAQPGDVEVWPAGPDGFEAESMVRDAAAWLPKDWIDSSNTGRRLHAELAPRGRYVDNVLPGNPDRQVSEILGSRSPAAPGVGEGVGTMVHELVHRVEATRDGISAAEWAFYDARVEDGRTRAWEPTVTMREATGVEAYGENEKTRPDDFVNVYAGKAYGDSMDSYYEVLTMGVEDLVTGQYGIIEKDQEHRQFVYGALSVL